MLLGTSRLTRLPADLFAEEQDTLTLVRFRLTERTNLSTYLTQELLVAGLEDDLGVLVSLGLRLDLYLGGELKKDGVCVTQREFQKVTLIRYAITNTDKLHLLLVAFGDSHHHVVDEGTVEAVESLLLLLLYGVVFFYYLECYLCVGNVDLDRGVNHLRHLALRAFHGNLVVVADLNGHSSRNAYGQFTYS